MKAKDAFGIVVRVIGLICICYGFSHIMGWLYVAVGHRTPEGWSGIDYLFAGVISIAVGIVFLRRSDLVVSFAYPKKRDEETDNQG